MACRCSHGTEYLVRVRVRVSNPNPNPNPNRVPRRPVEAERELRRVEGLADRRAHELDGLGLHAADELGVGGPELRRVAHEPLRDHEVMDLGGGRSVLEREELGACVRQHKADVAGKRGRRG